MVTLADTVDSGNPMCVCVYDLQIAPSTQACVLIAPTYLLCQVPLSIPEGLKA